MLRKFIPNTILLKSITRILREHFSREFAQKIFFRNLQIFLRNFKIIFQKRFSKMVAKMLCNSSKMTRIGFDVFQKIEKCQAFCRGRTCTVGKYKWFFGGSAGGRGIPAPSPGPGGFSAPQYPSLIIRFSAQNWPRGKIGMFKNRRQGIWSETRRLVRRGSRWAPRKIPWGQF